MEEERMRRRDREPESDNLGQMLGESPVNKTVFILSPHLYAYITRG